MKVCALEEIPADGALGVEVDDTPIAVVRSGADVYAVNDICSHAEVSLSEGEVYDGTIECWLHGSCFDLRSGKPTNPLTTQPVATYKVKVEGGDSTSRSATTDPTTKDYTHYGHARDPRPPRLRRRRLRRGEGDPARGRPDRAGR